MAGKPWTRDEALVAFNVYCRLPFGKLHARNPEILRVAKLLDRTPDSLAMKCCNFASLDPALVARGVKGLSKVAQLDRDIWTEFEANAEQISFDSEAALAKLAGRSVDEAATVPMGEFESAAASFVTARWEDVAGLDREALVRVRVNQKFFRTMILASYEAACAVCDLPIPSLLVASHIVPWSIDNSLRMNPRNGICLCSLHDRAFDTGIMRIESTGTIRVGSFDDAWKSKTAVGRFLLDFDAKAIRQPQRWQPDPLLLERKFSTAV